MNRNSGSSFKISVILVLILTLIIISSLGLANGYTNIPLNTHENDQNQVYSINLFQSNGNPIINETTTLTVYAFDQIRYSTDNSSIAFILFWDYQITHFITQETVFNESGQTDIPYNATNYEIHTMNISFITPGIYERSISTHNSFDDSKLFSSRNIQVIDPLDNIPPVYSYNILSPNPIINDSLMIEFSTLESNIVGDVYLTQEGICYDPRKWYAYNIFNMSTGTIIELDTLNIPNGTYSLQMHAWDASYNRKYNWQTGIQVMSPLVLPHFGLVIDPLITGEWPLNTHSCWDDGYLEINKSLSSVLQLKIIDAEVPLKEVVYTIDGTEVERSTRPSTFSVQIPITDLSGGVHEMAVNAYDTRGYNNTIIFDLVITNGADNQNSNNSENSGSSSKSISATVPQNNTTITGSPRITTTSGNYLNIFTVILGSISIRIIVRKRDKN